MTELNKEVLSELICQARVAAMISFKMTRDACEEEADEFDRECAHLASSDAHTAVCNLDEAFKRLTA